MKGVSLEEYGSVRACDLVLEDKLDLALVNMEMYNIDQLNSHVLIHDQLVFCVSPEHPLANHTSIKAADLDHQNVILFNKDSVQNAILRTRFDFGNVHPNIIMQGNQLYTMINFIRSGTVGCFLYSCITAGLPKYNHKVSVKNPVKEDGAEKKTVADLNLEDGDYTTEVTLEGGSGRATVDSPAAITIKDGEATATIVWSSPNYDYMLVDGEKYLPTNTEGNSTFEIPVSALDTALDVTADTVAMSTPHEIEYTLTFDSASLKAND